MAPPRLPKAIIKKYGITKKAWSVFRGSRSRSSAPKRASRGAPVAKRRMKTGRRTGARGFAGRLGGDFGVMLGAAAYGAGRGYVSAKIAPFTAKIPAGEISDEVGMLALSYLLWKGKVPMLNRVPMLKQVGFAGVVIESARIGEYALSRTMTASTGGQGLTVYQ